MTDRDRMILFLRMFAVFAVVHELIDAGRGLKGGILGAGLAFGSIVLATLVIARPAAARLAAAFLLVWTAHKFNAMPFTPNHILLTSVINLVLLAAMAWHAVRKPGGDVFETMAAHAGSIIRSAVIVVYGFAVLHKLNHDYLNLEVSCGSVLYAELKRHLPILPTAEWTRWPTVIGSLVTEGLIALLLFFPRTRVGGLLFGLAFHLLLAFHINFYVLSFSTLVTALYTLFLPLRVLNDGAALWSRFPAAMRRAAGLARWLPAAALGGAVLIFGAISASRGHFTPEEVRADLSLGEVPRYLAIAVVSAYTLGVYASVLAGRTLVGDRGLFRLRPSPALLALPLIVFNGLCPYLGVKTQTSFSMFSNLRTEMGRTNHLFMPILARLNDHQDQMVRVESSTNRRLSEIAASGEIVPLFELRREAANDPAPAFAVVYTEVASGLTRTAGRADAPSDPVFDAPSWLARKFLAYRTVPPLGEPCTCDH